MTILYQQESKKLLLILQEKKYDQTLANEKASLYGVNWSFATTDARALFVCLFDPGQYLVIWISSEKYYCLFALLRKQKKEKLIFY